MLIYSFKGVFAHVPLSYAGASVGAAPGKKKRQEMRNNDYKKSHTLAVVPVIDTSLWSNMWFKLSDRSIAQCGQMAHVHSNYIQPQSLDFHTTCRRAKLTEQQMEFKKSQI